MFRLAGESFLDRPKIEQRPIKEIFTHMAYLADRNNSESNELPS